ncbi:hypothetical protein SAMN04488072_11143 [Lentibacillus halodurans]|uniref:DUF945 domain-containing protein n=1 Tax=Lentibacillus halodurans TaxID=237679 RepID=A0A1I0ZF93_9BACI|nr:DUF6583 family protein [Lentibacillus halodurans]SFB24469.1 hypothetical protein SAMN04488072_11143 [Lentibacillus halodurans]
MEQNGEAKKGIPKKYIAIIVAALLVIGGSVAAFVLKTGSPKAQYFSAEKNTIEFITEKVEERYQSEFDWAKTTMENPTENSLELSAEYNGPPSNGMGMSPEQLINNSTIQLTSQLNQDENQLAADLQMNFAGIDINDVSMYVDADNVQLELPFLEEGLQIKDDDLTALLQEADPSLNDFNIDFEQLFNQMDGMLSDEDQSYIADEYFAMIYNELPDDAFESADETVTVQDESIDTEKITLQLSEQEVKELVTTVLEKMKNDDQLKEIIKDQIKMQQFGIFASNTMPAEMENEVDTMMEDFEQSIDETINGLEDFQIPDGLTSVVWVQDDLIVKRDFSVSMAPKDEETVSLTVQGNQLLQDAQQTIDYEFAIDEGALTLNADLSNQDNALDDSISVAAGDIELSYTGTSTLEDGTREFERTFSLNSQSTNDSGSLNWNGEATYDNDQMNAEHTLTVEIPDLPQDIISLHVKNDAQTINEVEQPDDANAKNLGGMSLNELEQYFQTEVATQFQQWLMEIMGAPGDSMNSF